MRVTILLLVSIFTFICCNCPKDPCANFVCKDNQECVDGGCKCVADTYNLGKWCARKEVGSRTAFFSKTSNCKTCWASDTAVVYFQKEPDINGEYSFTMAFPKDEQYWLTGVEQTVSNYYKRVDGDSFRIFGVENLYTCNEGGVKRNFPVVYGKLNPTKDSLKVKIVWHDAVNSTSTGLRIPVDSCTKLFTR